MSVLVSWIKLGEQLAGEGCVRLERLVLKTRQKVCGSDGGRSLVYLSCWQVGWLYSSVSACCNVMDIR